MASTLNGVELPNSIVFRTIEDAKVDTCLSSVHLTTVRYTEDQVKKFVDGVGKCERNSLFVDILCYLGANDECIRQHTPLPTDNPEDYFRLWMNLPDLRSILSGRPELRYKHYESLLSEYPHNVLIEYLADEVLLPYIPSPAFLEHFSVAKKLSDILDSPELSGTCAIAGGFLVRCHVGGAAVNEIHDIDIFCIGNSTNVVTKIQDAYDCVSFTNHNTTTVFVRNSSTNIQIIAMPTNRLECILHEFDFDFCKLAYYKGSFVALTAFHKACGTKRVKATKNISCASRVEKYSRMGFTIDTSDVKLPEIKSYIDASNKYYIWRDETLERLSYMIRLVYGPGYAHTVLPLKDPVLNINEYYEKCSYYVDNNDEYILRWTERTPSHINSYIWCKRAPSIEFDISTYVGNHRDCIYFQCENRYDTITAIINEYFSDDKQVKIRRTMFVVEPEAYRVSFDRSVKGSYAYHCFKGNSRHKHRYRVKLDFVIRNASHGPYDLSVKMVLVLLVTRIEVL